jgi:hypothetical protein
LLLNRISHFLRALAERAMCRLQGRRALVVAAGWVLTIAVGVGQAAAFDAGVAWTRVGDAVGYKVYVRYVGGSFVEAAAPSVGSANIVEHTVHDLALGPTYFFSVTTVAPSGEESRLSNELYVDYARAATAVDSDGDGLTDAEEDTNLNQQVDPGETDPNNPDSDGDGVTDGIERSVLGTDPLSTDSDADGITDLVDTCNDIDGDGFGLPGLQGATCAPDNCIDTFNELQIDSDLDTMGDACDPCTNVAGGQNFTGSSKIKLKRINTDPVAGNDVVLVKGDFHLATGTDFSQLDPMSEGARIMLTGADGTVRVDEILPATPFTGGSRGGHGWKVSGNREVWKFLDKRSARINGIARFVVKDRSRRSPKMVRVLLKGKKGNYPVITGDDPVTATIVLGDSVASSDGLCGESAFDRYACRFNANGRILLCK